jgi:hypothetical protein
MQYRSLVTAINLSFVLFAVFFLSAATLVAAPTPLVYWHSTNTGIPANIEVLAVTPLPRHPLRRHLRTRHPPLH